LTQCAGDSKLTCGGGWANNVYETSGVAESSLQLETCAPGSPIHNINGVLTCEKLFEKVAAHGASTDRLVGLFNDKLSQGQQLVSPNGKYQLIMQNDQNLVTYDLAQNKKVGWASDTNNNDMGQSFSVTMQSTRRVSCLVLSRLVLSRLFSSGLCV